MRTLKRVSVISNQIRFKKKKLKNFSLLFEAIYGYPFCIAGRKAFNHLSANTLRVLAINSVGDFVLFLGKALVVFFTIIAGIELLHHKEDVHHMWVLLVLAGLFAYLIAHSFITVYEVSKIKRKIFENLCNAH